MENRIKSFQDLEIKFFDDEKSVTHIITSNVVDRAGDIVVPSGMKKDNYEKNPIVLFQHDYDKPIGNNAWIKIITEKDREYALAKTKFSKKNDFAQDIYNLYKEGVLRSWSIGFYSFEDKTEEIKDAEGRVTGYKFLEWELLEYSAVSIPANPDALTEAVKMVKTSFARDYLELESMKLKLDKFVDYESEIQKLQAEIRELNSIIKGNEELLQKINTFENFVNELNSKLLELETKLEKYSSEIVGNSKMDKETKEKLIREAITGAIRRIRGSL